MQELTGLDSSASPSEAAAALASVCAEVLGLPSVLPTDNLFDLGMTSFVAAKVVARVRRHGIVISLDDFFQRRTVSDLAELVDNRELSPILGTSTSGTAPLSPDQMVMLDVFANIEQATFPFVVSVPASVTATMVNEAVNELLALHDAMRASVRSQGGLRHLYFEPKPRRDIIENITADLPPEERLRLIELASGTVSIDAAPMCRITFHQMSNGQRPLVHFVFHHLIFDAVSVDIWLDDFDHALADIVHGLRPSWPRPAGSLAVWCRALPGLAAGLDQAGMLRHWMEHLGSAPISWPPQDRCDGDNTFESIERISVRLSEQDTRRLRRALNSRPGLTVQASVLAALAHGFSATWPGSQMVALIANNGRRLRPTRTSTADLVASTLTTYPILLTGGIGRPLDQVQRVSRLLNEMAEDGLRFNLLRCYGKAEIRDNIAMLPLPSALVVYQDEFGDLEFQMTRKEAMPIRLGGMRTGPRAIPFQIMARCGNQLTIQCAYSANEFYSATVRTWLGHAREFMRSFDRTGE